MTLCGAYAPHETKQQQREHRIAKPEVPDHGIAAYGARNRQGDHTRDQRPMENPRRQVPDSDLGQALVVIHVHASFMMFCFMGQLA
jgi:hypothetical protein